MNPIIYHNPKCGTSRNTLAMLKQAGMEPEVIEYLKTPPSRATLEKLIKDSGLTVREILRKKGTPYEELGLDDKKWTDAQLIDFIEQHPILMNRPFVTTAKGTRLCRPSDVLLEILDEEQIGAFTKEDGEVVIPAKG
ncbi:Arsenate reductase [Pseudovibrio sp. Ad46]|uniref:arsenate reductase (glutaredoxin) n=1 Tax=unclassified Pseudovibrio TaxID=2627060 RepID=UPI0007AE57EE|nr:MULTISPECIES: arsenate reductase (glutaredoxin) [unclassified Pseudovibrio]KZK77068.1 Arsenate reductase [Pseudovibrio sp. Ad46]KZK97542.1 Arsenate reductase [Pseudovibrio sp. W74]KZL04754.1 Arsenate reductase [Pseudovibrio sp. Ad14]